MSTREDLWKKYGGGNHEAAIKRAQQREITGQKKREAEASTLVTTVNGSIRKTSNILEGFGRRTSDTLAAISGRRDTAEDRLARKDYDEKSKFDLVKGQEEIDELERQRAALLKPNTQPATTYLTGGTGTQSIPYGAALQAPSEEESEAAELGRLIAQKKQYLNQSKRIQEGIELSNVTENDDFRASSGYVSTKANDLWGNLTSQYSMGYDDLTYEYINGRQNGMREEILQKSAVYNASGDSLGAANRWNTYDHMTEDEIAIYNYHYAKNGKETAERYLDSIQETLNHRKATGMFRNMAGKPALEIAFGAAAGLDQFASGVKSKFSDADYIPQTATQMASGMVREDLKDDSIPLWYNFAKGKWEDKVFGASAGQIAYDAVNTTANMAPSVLSSMAANVIAPGSGAVVGNATMYMSSSGNAYQEALNLGYDKGQARAYSTLVGASEAGLQYLLGGISSLGGKVSGNAAAKILNGIDSAFARTALKLGGNMLSEGAEEGLQEVLTPMFKNMALHADEDIDWGQVAYSGLLGALTAGVMEGRSTISGAVGTRRQGERLKEGGITAQQLSEIGSTFAADTVAHQLAGRVDENTGAYTMGRLFNEIGATLTEQNVNDITEALVERGMDRETARKNAEVMAVVVEGGSLTDKQAAVIEANEVLAEAVWTTVIDPDAAWSQRTKGYNEALAAQAQRYTETELLTREAGEWLEELGAGDDLTARAIAKAVTDQELSRKESMALVRSAEAQKVLEEMRSGRETAEAAPAKDPLMEKLEQAEAAEAGPDAAGPEAEGSVKAEVKSGEDGGDFAASKSDTAEYGGKPVAIKGIADTKGDMTLELEDGRTVKASEVLYADEGEALVYEAVASLGAPADIGNILVKNYREGAENVEAEDYAPGMVLAFNHGRLNLPKAQITDNPYIAKLTEVQRNSAYVLGQRFGGKQVASQQAIARRARFAQRFQQSGQPLTGSVHYDGDIRTLNVRQRASVAALEKVADALGVQIHLFESYENGEGQRVYKDKSGEEVNAPNGRYDTKTGDIHIDIHAGISGEDTMLFTAAHELTHFIKQWSPAKFKVLANFLMEQYGEKGIRVEELIERQQAKAMRSGRELSYDEAFEEMVADSMETMLADGNIVEKLAKLKTQDRSLLEKLCDGLRELAEKIRKVYEGLKPDSREGRYVAEMKGSIEGLQKLFTEALEDAGQNFRAAEQAKTGEAAAVSEAEADVPEADWSDFDESTVEFSRRGNEKTARMGGVKFSFRNSSTGMANDALLPYSEELRGIIERNGGIVVDSGEALRDLVNLAFDNPKIQTTAYFGVMTESALTDIEKSVPNLPKELNGKLFKQGRQYSVAVTTDSIRHLVDGKKAMTRADVLDYLDRLADTIIEKDSVHFDYYTDSRNNKLRGLHFKKAFTDGTMVAFEIISSKKMSLNLQTMFIEKAAYQKKKSAKPPLMRNASAHTPEARGSQTSSFIVAQDKDSVNTKLSARDSQGRKLTEEQQSYFAESRIRDGQGRLMVMYHGTDADFTAFDPERVGLNTGNGGFYGRGFYFTTHREDATNYGKNVHSYYLNARKPLRLDGDAWLYELGLADERTAVEVDEVSVEYLPNGFANVHYTTADAPGMWRSSDKVSLAQLGKDSTGKTFVRSKINAAPNILPRDLENLAELAQNRGFDAIIGEGTNIGDLGTEVVVFYPEQIKSVNNAAPTNDPDSRFSLRQPVEETKTLIAMHNLTEEKLEKAIELGGFPMPSIAVTRADIPHTNFGEITLVMDKRTVDPKANRRNDVYSADAWTPTFPRTEYEANSEVEDRVRRTLEGLKGKIAPQFQGDLRRVQYDLEHLLNSYDGEENLIRHVMDNYGLKASYLESQGRHIDEVQVEREIPRKYNEAATAKYEAIINALGTRDPAEIGTMPLKDIRENYGEALEQIAPGISKTALRLSRFMSQTIDYLMDDGSGPATEVVTDYAATKQAVDDALDKQGFEDWVRELFSGIEGDRGIHNGKDRFTPSGRSRSFQQTHLPVTLNSRLYDLIDEIDREAGRKGTSNNLIRFDQIGQIITEASETGRYNVADIQKVFRENYQTISDELAMKVKELLFDVSQMPVNLFEAKPRRAVRFDEVLAAVIPSNAGEGLRAKLAENGVRVMEYESGNTQDRLEKVNGVESAKFSERDPAAEKLNRALEKENAAQAKEIEYLRELVRLQGKVTNGTKFTRGSVRELAKRLMKEAGATGNYLELSEMLNGVYEYIAGLDDPAVALEWEDIAEQTGRAAQWLVDHVEVKPDRGEYANDILRDLRGRRISLNEGQMAEAASQYGSYNDFRKAMFGSVVLAKDGTPLDVVWQELADQYPGTFDADVGDADMPLKLAEIVEGLQDTDLAAEEWQYWRVDLTRQMQQAVYDGYWKASTLYTVADAWQKKVDALKKSHAKTMGELEQARAEIQEIGDRHRWEIRELRRKGREVTRMAQAQTAERYRDARKKATEGRNKTAERRKIGRTVKELEKLLLKGDKKKHVKEGMRNLVEEALASATVLFADTYSDEELVLNGIGTDLTPEENRLIDETRYLLGQKKDLLSDSAIAKESEAVAVGDTAGYEKRMKQAEKLDRQIASNMSKLHGVLVRERSRLNRATVGAVLANLSAAYRSLGQSDDLYIRGAAREEVWQHLDSLAESIGGATAKDLTLAQLTEINKAFRMVLHTVRSANKLFAEGQKESLSESARMAALEVTSNGKNSRLGVKLVEELKKFSFNNLKPVYFFEHLGSRVMRGLYKGLLNGQSQWAQDVDEARAYFRSTADRAGLDSWDMEKTHTFRAASGDEFKLNLQQMMSLYAYSRREQARDHIRKGGIVIDSDTDIQEVVEIGGKLKVKLKGKSTDATAYNIDDVTLGEIVSKLTKEQKTFVEEMQSYLSDVMGGKGNEVSMTLYGVKLFTEQNYLPIRSARQYMVRAKEQAEQTAKVKNAGFTKSTVAHASNPVVLTPFLDLWSDHVNEMSLYHAMTLPLEDLHRVYTFSQTGDGGRGSQSVTAAIENAFGAQATGYIDQLMKDLNGGARVDNTTGIINKSVALFKKGSTFLSASVVIQQPSAIVRATALVDSKYFQWAKLPAKWALDLTARRKQHDRLWAECKKYAPIALIKEMGYFDTSVGRSTRDFIQAKEYSGWSEKARAMIRDSGYRDEVFSRAPALADELAWCSIWEAIKREQHDKHPELRVGSEEFLKLCGERFTEVIDKTQVYDSVLARSANMRSKDTGMKMATSFMAEPTVSANMVADAILRGKRGDKKAARRAVASVISSGILNAMLYSLVAAARDDDEDKEYWEKYLGSATGEVFEVINPATYLPFARDVWSLIQGYDVERSDMALVADLVNAFRSLNSDSKPGLKKTEDFVSVVGKLFGFPVGNVWRDARALYNVFGDAVDGQGSTAVGIGYAVMENLPFGKAASNGQQLYEARISGNTEHERRVAERFKDESGARAALRKALRENDSRIREAAIAWNEGRLEDYMSVAKAIIAEKHFHQDDVVAAIRAEAESLLPDEESGGNSSAHKGLFTAEAFAVAAADGDGTMMKAIREDLIQTAVSNGKSQEEAEKSASSSIKSKLKDCVLEGLVAEEKAQTALAGYCGMDAGEAREAIAQWRFEAEHGNKWSERMGLFTEAAVDGSAKAEAIRQEVIAASVAGGQSREEAEKDFQGSFRTALGDLYEAEGVSDKQAASLLEKYGGKTAEGALTTVRYWEFRRNNPGVNADDSWIDKYYSEIQGSGIDIETYVSYRDQVKGITGSGKKAGRMAVIDSLPISDAEKDALYYAEGWARSTIGEAPWH